jgi:zinc transporter, ZIP family
MLRLVLFFAACVVVVFAHGPGRADHETHELHVGTATTLSIVSGLAATLGGVIVVTIGVPSQRLLGHLLSFSAGVMLYISYGDLLVHSASSGTSSALWVSQLRPLALIGTPCECLQMMAGMVGFWLLANLIPEPELPVEPAKRAWDKLPLEELREAATSLDVAPSASRSDLIRALEARPPQRQSKSLLLTGLIACLGISLHNLPEGLIVYTQTLGGVCKNEWSGWEHLSRYLGGCMGRGLAIAIAMSLHNIPEGMAVAAPILAATGSKYEAMKWCFISSIVEPVGAIVLGLSLHSALTPQVESILEAIVGGIMIMLCLMELIPTAAKFAGAKESALSNLAGQFTIFLGLWLMHP